MFMEGMAWHNMKDELIETHAELVLCDTFNWTLDYVRSLKYEDRINIQSYMIGKDSANKETTQNGKNN